MKRFKTLLFNLIPVLALSKCIPHLAEAQEINLFNGKDLQGWAGLPTVWSVKDEAITGTGMGEKAADGELTSLVWQGGKVADFSLKLQFKITEIAGSGYRLAGIQFRGNILDKNLFTVAGYMGKMSCDTNATGSFTEYYARNYTVNCGQKAVLSATANPRKPEVNVVDTFGEGSSYHKSLSIIFQGWNDYEIVANGDRIQVFVNGHPSVEVLESLKLKI